MNSTSTIFETNTRDEFAKAYLTLGHAFNFAALAQNTDYCQITVYGPNDSGKSLISDALISAWRGASHPSEVRDDDKVEGEIEPAQATKNTISIPVTINGLECVRYFSSMEHVPDRHLKETLAAHKKGPNSHKYPIIFSTGVIRPKKYRKTSIFITTTKHKWERKISEVFITDERFQTPALLRALPRLVAA